MFGIFASAVELGTMPTIRNRGAPTCRVSPMCRPSVLDAATSSGFDGALPSETCGMPGPCSGAPKAVTFRVDVPSFMIVADTGQWGRGHDAGRSGNPGQVDVGERCRTQEGSGRAVFDHECVDTQGIDGVAGLDPKAVREPGHHERHPEDQCRADDRDDEAPLSPLHVAQGREEHSPKIPTARLPGQSLLSGGLRQHLLDAFFAGEHRAVVEWFVDAQFG